MEKGSTHAASTRTYHILLLTAAALLLAAVAAEPSLELFRGLWRIVTYEAGLITDPVVTGGLGAALLNMGLVLLCGVGLARSQKLPFTGASLACLLMLAGFAMLGKNILNIQPILLGTWLYSRFTQERFAKYVYLSLYGTCLAPISGHFGWPYGVLAGFIHASLVLQTGGPVAGLNLYNNGFSGGLIAIVLYPTITAIRRRRRPTLQDKDYYDQFQESAPIDTSDLARTHGEAAPEEPPENP